MDWNLWDLELLIDISRLLNWKCHLMSPILHELELTRTRVNYVTPLNKIRFTSFKLFTQTSWIYTTIFLLFGTLLCIVIFLSSTCSSLGKKKDGLQHKFHQKPLYPHNNTSTIIITSKKQLRLQNFSQELYSINNIKDKINECWLVNEEDTVFFPFIISRLWLSLLMMKW